MLEGPSFARAAHSRLASQSPNGSLGYSPPVCLYSLSGSLVDSLPCTLDPVLYVCVILCVCVLIHFLLFSYLSQNKKLEKILNAVKRLVNCLNSCRRRRSCSKETAVETTVPQNSPVTGMKERSYWLTLALRNRTAMSQPIVYQSSLVQFLFFLLFLFLLLLFMPSCLISLPTILFLFLLFPSFHRCVLLFFFTYKLNSIG